jgi:hypothetical protein
MPGDIDIEVVLDDVGADAIKTGMLGCESSGYFHKFLYVAE